jgi:hypothetical protein
MEFIEDDERNFFERRIALQPAGENAFGQDLDTCCGTRTTLESRAIANGSPDRLAKRLRHARCNRPCREPPRLEHDDLTIAYPRRIEQRQRNARGLTRTGRRLKYDVAMRGERCEQLWQRRFNWKIG